MFKHLLKFAIIFCVAVSSHVAADDPPELKIAAICTAWQPRWHADVIVTKFLAGFPTDDGLIAPKVRIASLYIDQTPPADIGLPIAEHYGVPVFDSITEALTLGGDTLAVDGVLLIAEHGAYPRNRLNATMYPRMRMSEEIFRVFDAAGRSVPVFIDKHLSYTWLDSKWIYDRARELNVPLMAGSSVPFVWRDPPLEHPPGSSIEEAVVLTYAGPDSYAVHGFEMMQCMLERRKGAETGVASVQCLRGTAVYEAAEAGLFSMELAEAAAATIDVTKPGGMRAHVRNPIAVIINYADGTRGTILMMHEWYGMHWAYAARVDGRITATRFVFPGLPTIPAFSYLGLNIQQMFLTGQPQYPVERTLLASGITEAALISMKEDGRVVETPHLVFDYSPPENDPIMPTAPQPGAAMTVPWPPEGIKHIYEGAVKR